MNRVFVQQDSKILLADSRCNHDSNIKQLWHLDFNEQGVFDLTFAQLQKDYSVKTFQEHYTKIESEIEKYQILILDISLKFLSSNERDDVQRTLERFIENNKTLLLHFNNDEEIIQKMLTKRIGCLLSLYLLSLNKTVCILLFSNMKEDKKILPQTLSYADIHYKNRLNYQQKARGASEVESVLNNIDKKLKLF